MEKIEARKVLGLNQARQARQARQASKGSFLSSAETSAGGARDRIRLNCGNQSREFDNRQFGFHLANVEDHQDGNPELFFIRRLMVVPAHFLLLLQHVTVEKCISAHSR